MNNEDEKKDLIKILSGEKRQWLVQVDYFAHNVDTYIISGNLKHRIFKVIFSVKANSEQEAKEKAFEIYESEFTEKNLKNIPQPELLSPDALDIFKFKNGVVEIKFDENFPI